MITDKTKEEVNTGYQILGAIMPKKANSHNKQVTFWQSLTHDAKGFEKWFNVLINGLSMLAVIIITISIIFIFFSYLYKLLRIFI